MKRKLLLQLITLLVMHGLQAQVTRINNNKSLRLAAPLSNSKAIYVSEIDNTLWATDGSLGGTVQLSTTIQWVGYIGSTGNLNGTLVFAGTTPATGTEVYTTDGTPGGTALVKDIYPGTTGSLPNDAAVLNGFIYFSATRPAEGRELWRTNGTDVGTTIVKDIVTGSAGSNTPGNYHLFSNGSYLLFAAQTASNGVELWKSNGTDAGTDLLLNINTANGGAASSNPRFFYPLNNTVLFTATDATKGEEFWRTDGTPGGTSMLSEINPGTDSATSIGFMGIPFAVFQGFHLFNNRAYFRAFDGTNTGLVWSTDGSPGNTTLLQDVIPGSGFTSFISIGNAINLPTKFIFSVGDAAGLAELWESDGTTGGTKPFKAFAQVTAGDIPFTFANFSFANGIFTQPLFQGNKFFFRAGTVSDGNELWISDGVDGTVTHTHIVKDINPGTGDGLSLGYSSYIYTTAGLYFPATNGTNGVELWKTDGTSGSGTAMVQDIFPGLDSSKPQVNYFMVNSKILFEATDGDDPNETDLFAVDGNFTPLPVSLADFTVQGTSADALINWRTFTEINSLNFIIQRSFDGIHFQDIGTVAALGSSSFSHGYAFTDVGVMNTGKPIAYYRLKSNDKDGKTTFSPVIALKIKNVGKWDLKLMSNPVRENLIVLLSGISEKVQFTIIDITGKKLYSNSFGSLNGQLSLPANTLPKGTYMLLTESGKQRKTIQFVK